MATGAAASSISGPPPVPPPGITTSLQDLKNQLEATQTSIAQLIAQQEVITRNIDILQQTTKSPDEAPVGSADSAMHAKIGGDSDSDELKSAAGIAAENPSEEKPTTPTRTLDPWAHTVNANWEEQNYKDGKISTGTSRDEFTTVKTDR